MITKSVTLIKYNLTLSLSQIYFSYQFTLENYELGMLIRKNAFCHFIWEC